MQHFFYTLMRNKGIKFTIREHNCSSFCLSLLVLHAQGFGGALIWSRSVTGDRALIFSRAAQTGAAYGLGVVSDPDPPPLPPPPQDALVDFQGPASAPYSELTTSLAPLSSS